MRCGVEDGGRGAKAYLLHIPVDQCATEYDLEKSLQKRLQGREHQVNGLLLHVQPDYIYIDCYTTGNGCTCHVPAHVSTQSVCNPDYPC